MKCATMTVVVQQQTDRQTFKHLIISPALNSGGFCVWHKLHIISRWQVGRRGDAPPLMMSPYTSTQTQNTDKLM